MKTIQAKIVGEKCVILSGGDAPELNEHPAYMNWDKLRNLGWVNCRLLNEPRDDGLTWHYPETDLDRLELEIATYDWYYQMSDDQRVYNAGRAKDGRISALFEKVNKEKAVKLWNDYVMQKASSFSEPENFKKDYLERF